jgi:HSP20 family protein
VARFFFSDPYALRGALERLPSQGAGMRDSDQPIPVDVYADGEGLVIEAALPGANLDGLELSCEEGLLTIRGTLPAPERNFAVQEIPRGSFSRTLALPGECLTENARASYEQGILRIVIPRSRPKSRSIHIEVQQDPQAGDRSRIVAQKSEADKQIVDAVKGKDYREVPPAPKGRRGSEK